jgi:hypothetical protein
MKKEKEKIYSEWIHRRQSVPVPEGFSEQVMGEIARYALIRNIDFPVVYRALSSRAVQWVAVAGAVLLGLFRLSYIARVLLIP